MKKILGMLVVCLGFWFTGLTVVHADIKPLPPDYDPIQGGMILRPPHDLWIKADNSVSFIPFAYLPGGSINTAQLKQLNYFVELNGKDTPIPHVVNPSLVYINPALGWGLGTVETNGLGLVVRANRVGVYPIHLLMRFGQQADEYETQVTLHIVDTISTITGADTSSKFIMSPLPQLVIWHHLDGEVTIENNTSYELVSNDLKWPVSPLFSFIPPTSMFLNPISGLTETRLNAVNRVMTVKNADESMTINQQFGIPEITVYSGQPIKLDLDYMYPDPGTKLAFIWEFYSKTATLISTQSTPTPELPSAFVQPNATSVRLILEYSDDQTTVEYASSVINLTYKSQPVLSIPPVESIVNLPTIIQGPTTVNAGFADWSVNQVGSWHFTITTSTLKQADGTTLPAQLKWPDGAIITPNQPYTTTYSGSQLVPLSQLDWVFQQQPKAKAGVYQADLLFEAIAGP